VLRRKKTCFWDISTKPKIGTLEKLVRLEASTKPHVHKLIHEFLINMAFTMVCPNFKKGLKMVYGPLGVNMVRNSNIIYKNFNKI
jgi:hypothetical protein